MKVQLPVVNRAAGRTAGFIFQTYNGRTYVRAMPASYHKSESPKKQQTEAKYYNIMRQYQLIYDDWINVVKRAPQKSRNTFNEYAKGIFAAAGTYDTQNTQQPPRRFGTDTQQQVKIIPLYTRLRLDGKYASLVTDFSIKLWRRNFFPAQYSVLLVNKTQQTIMMISDHYKGNSMEIDFTNDLDFLPTDTIRIYLMLSDYNFLSNFYLMNA